LVVAINGSLPRKGRVSKKKGRIGHRQKKKEAERKMKKIMKNDSIALQGKVASNGGKISWRRWDKREL